MKRKVLWSRFHLLPIYRWRITGKNGPDVTYGSPRALPWALVFNIQGHTCYIKPEKLCDVSYVMVWHTKTRHEIRYVLNFKTFPKTVKYDSRRNLQRHLDGSIIQIDGSILQIEYCPLWRKPTNSNQISTLLQHCPWIFLLPSINFHNFLTFNNSPTSSHCLCKSCMEL